MNSKTSEVGPLRRRDIAVFLLFVGICGLFLAAGGLVTAPSAGDWFQSLNRPPFAPPDWVFSPVWTALFLLMAIAGWRVWRRAGWCTAHAIFGLQLLLNVGWSALFFGLQRPDLALLEILVLTGAIIWNLRAFAGIDAAAAWLLVPYLAWVSFAVLLNAGFVWVN